MNLMFLKRIFAYLPNKEERKEFIEKKILNNKNVQLSSEQIDNIVISFNWYEPCKNKFCF